MKQDSKIFHIEFLIITTLPVIRYFLTSDLRLQISIHDFRFFYLLFLPIFAASNGGYSSVRLEHQIVVLRVAGSSPVSHPAKPRFPTIRDGVFPLYNSMKMNYWFLLIPLLTALTGWIVIRLTIRLLFRPLSPQNVMGFKWQGILPKHKQQIADKLGNLVALEFSSFSLEEKISDPQNFENVKPLIETHIDDFLRNKLKEQMPMIGMFIGDKTIGTLKTIFIQEIETLFPQVMEQFAGNLKSKLNLQQMVSSRITGISPTQIENLLYTNMANEIRNASLFGAAVGLLIGIIQLIIILYIR